MTHRDVPGRSFAVPQNTSLTHRRLPIASDGRIAYESFANAVAAGKMTHFPSTAGVKTPVSAAGHQRPSHAVTIAYLLCMPAIGTSPTCRNVQDTIGFVHARSREETVSLVAAFRHGLAENGFVEGKDVSVEYRFADGIYGRLPELISELLKRPAAVLVTGADPAALAGKQATTAVPIVFSVGGDPVELGLVESFSRPGGNVTGMTLLTSSL